MPSVKSIQPTSPHAHAMYRQQPVERRLNAPNKRVVTLFEAYPQDGVPSKDPDVDGDGAHHHGRVASLPAPVLAAKKGQALHTRSLAKASKAQGKGKGGRGPSSSNLPRGAHMGDVKQLHLQPPPPPPLSLLPAAQRPGPPLLPHQMAGRAPLVVQELRRSALGSLALALCRDTLYNAGLTHSLAVFDVETAGAVTPPPLPPKSPGSPPQGRFMHGNPRHPSAPPPGGGGGVKDRTAVAPTDAEALLDCLDALRKSAAKFSEPLRAAHRSGKPLLLGLVNVLGAANAHLADPAVAKMGAGMPAVVEEKIASNATTGVNGVAGTSATGDKENHQVLSPQGGGEASDDLTSAEGPGSSNSVTTHLNNNNSSSSSSGNANGSLLSRSFGATFGSDAEKSVAELSLKVGELQSELARQEEVNTKLVAFSALLCLLEPPDRLLMSYATINMFE